MTGEEINSASVFEIRQGVNVSTGNRSLVNILQQKWREHTPTKREATARSRRYYFVFLFL
jgi:hypothetical protein